jgi:hypothetical protein
MNSNIDVLSGKTILMISPQAWGKMFVSKHHYAVELAKNGALVYFLNPPDQENWQPGGEINIQRSEQQDNLFLIDHRLSFSYNIKFHFIGLFHLLMRSHVKKILRKIGRPVDIVWSFDLGHLYPFSHFPAASYKLFHPVDEPLNKTAIDSAGGARAILSVTKEILEKYHAFDVPKHFINHGVTGDFLEAFDIDPMPGNPVRVGFSGNLLREDIDRTTFLQLIGEHPAVIFECWGSYQPGQSNIGGGSGTETANFVGELQRKPNVVLHGVVDTKTLAKELLRMDAFLICYDINKDQSKGTNYHKVMEFLSRGKVIISNNITTYADEPDLIRMTRSREGNGELPALFRETLAGLASFNATPLQQRRIQYARQNSYMRQIERITGEIIKKGLQQ